MPGRRFLPSPRARFSRFLFIQRPVRGLKVSLVAVMDQEPAPHPTDITSSDGVVIDLAVVAATVRQLLAWYDDLLADRDPPKGGLNDVLTQLKELPTVPGWLGRDITLMANGGRGASRHDIIGALERLRRVAAMSPEPTPAPTNQRSAEPKRLRPSCNQPSLPGFATS